MSRPFSNVTYRLGPGAMTPTVRLLLFLNVAVFLLTFLVPSLVLTFGLIPAAVIQKLWVWQPITYMFLHGSLTHILFNMLALWMFGVELELAWGTRFFAKYYFVSGVGAGISTILVSLLPFAFADQMYAAVTVGASGAIYGLLLAYALIYPNRTIYYIVFPIPARLFVIIVGAISLFSAMSGAGSGVAHLTHLGGILAGYLYLLWHRGSFMSQVRSQFLRWRLSRLRKKFEVHDGGRGNNPNRWVH